MNLDNSIVQKKNLVLYRNYQKGEDTFLGPEIYEDGVELSGGQWQKLALLRAIISKSTNYYI